MMEKELEYKVQRRLDYVRNYNKKYYERNKDRCKELDKQRYELNKENILKKNKKYRQAHSISIKEQRSDYYEKNRELIRRKQSVYYHKNSEKLSKINKKWREHNIERKKLMDKNYQILHKKKIKKFQHEYYLKNKGLFADNHKNWKLKNKEQWVEIQHRHLKKIGFPFKMDPRSFKFALLSWSKTIKKQSNNQCQNCPSQAEISHHIIHKSKYPTLSLNLNNGIALCRKCHNEVHGWNTSL